MADETVRIYCYDGPRADLRALFELAEDSAVQLDSYLDEGEVFVADAGGAGIVGHLQLVDVDESAGEIKSVAVAPDHQQHGIGRALVRRAVERSRERGWAALFVSTATADIDSLRFYQRLGFRFAAVRRDAFTEATGYPPGLTVDGIPLHDAIVLSMTLTS